MMCLMSSSDMLNDTIDGEPRFRISIAAASGVSCRPAAISASDLPSIDRSGANDAMRIDAAPPRRRRFSASARSSDSSAPPGRSAARSEVEDASYGY